MTEHEKNYIMQQINSCMEKVKPTMFGVKYDPYGVLRSLKVAIEAMATDTEKVDDWSESIETEIDKIKQRVTYLEMLALSGSRRGDDDGRKISCCWRCSENLDDRQD